MRVLVVGGGAREHALVWSLTKSGLASDVICAPGNPGIELIAECVPVSVNDHYGLVELATVRGVGGVVIGPEAPLVGGLTDLMNEFGVGAFGPTASSARIEGSKSFAKRLMTARGVPTASAAEFSSYESAISHVERMEGPVVVKADGLAAGKGVTVCEDREQARVAVTVAMKDFRFGESGAKVLIEEKLVGEELTVLAFCDGKTILPMMAAQDFKRAYDGNAGPMTGGMGSYAPVPFYDRRLEEEVLDRVLEPIVAALLEEADPYVGVLYAGLMRTDQGVKVIEFNCRFGDPETQALLPLLGSDLGELMAACVDGSLAGMQLRWSSEACVCVVAASGGYPETDPLPIGFEISGLEAAAKVTGIPVFHAGTQRKGDCIVTAGGRVVAVSALGPDVGAARTKAYEAISHVSFEGMRCRSDIAATTGQTVTDQP